jgi:hypothetical protein
MGDVQILAGKPEGNRPLRRPRYKCGDDDHVKGVRLRL